MANLITGDVLRHELARLRGKSLADAEIELTGGPFTWTGRPQAPRVTKVTLAGETLTEGKDYAWLAPEASEVGEYHAVVIGIGEFTGHASKQWSIGKAKFPIQAETDFISFKGEIGETGDFSFTLVEECPIQLVNENPGIVTATLEGTTIHLTTVAKGDAVIKLVPEGSEHFEGGEFVLNVYVNTLNAYSWAELGAIAKAGQAKEHFAEGDMRRILINGETYHAELVGLDYTQMFDTDPYFHSEEYNNGSNKIAMTFMIRELMDDTVTFSQLGHARWSALGEGDIRAELRKFEPTNPPTSPVRLEQELCDQLREFYNPSYGWDDGQAAVVLEHLGDKLYLPALVNLTLSLLSSDPRVLEEGALFNSIGTEYQKYNRFPVKTHRNSTDPTQGECRIYTRTNGDLANGSPNEIAILTPTPTPAGGYTYALSTATPDTPLAYTFCFGI